MSTSFNPYRKWLGIPERELPANHYRLLGLELFESELAVIASSIDRQTNHLRSHRNGEHARLADLLIEEIKIAGRCLLTPEMKAIYDQGLHERLASESSDPSDSPASPTIAADQGGSRTSNFQGVQPIPVVAPVLATTDMDTPSFAPVTSGRSIHSRRRRSVAVGIVGHVLAPVIGLTLGYLILVFAIGKQYDFLGLFKESAGPVETSGDVVDEQSEKQQELAGSAEKIVLKAPAGEEPSAQANKESTESTKKHAAGDSNAQPAVDPFDKAQHDLWASLERQDIDPAKVALNAVRVNAADARQRERYEGLRFLFENVSQARQAIDLSLARLQPGDELRVGESPSVVVQSNPRSLELRTAGKNYQFPPAKLPFPVILALIANADRPNDPLVARWLGALHLVYAEGRRSEADRLWKVASAGAQIPPGAIELIHTSPIAKGDAQPPVATTFPQPRKNEASESPAKASVNTTIAVDLPPTGAQLVELVPLPREDVELELASLPNQAGHPRFRVLPSTIPKMWLVRRESPADEESKRLPPVARFVVDPRVLKFQWESPSPSPQDQLLRNSILRVSWPGSSSKIALRTVKGHAPLKLALEEKMTVHQIELESSPPIDALRLELLGVDNFTPQPKISQSRLVPGGKLTVTYDDAVDLETRVLLNKNGNASTIRLATVFRLGKQQPMEMTTKKVNSVKDGLVKKIETMQADLQSSEQLATSLPGKLSAAKNIRINANTPGAPLQQMQKNSAISAIERDMTKNDKTIASLKRGIPQTKGTLDELTRIAALGNRLNGQARLQFRLFIEIGEEELTLISSKIE